MSTNSNPIQNRTESGRFPAGVSGNPNGRPRGLFSRRTLAAARKRGENGLAKLDYVVDKLFDKAAGEESAKHVSLEAIGFLRDTIDGPLVQAESTGNTNMVQVVVHDIAASGKKAVSVDSKL